MRALQMAIVAAALATVVGCTTTDPSPSPPATTSAAPTSTATSAPRPDPIVSASESTPQVSLDVPADWNEDAGVVPTTAPDARGWSTGGDGSIASVVLVPRNGATPEQTYQERFGEISEAGQSDVTFEVERTAVGYEVLYVDVIPAGGLGGATETYFFVFGQDSIAEGVLSYTGEPGDDSWSEMRALADSLEFIS